MKSFIIALLLLFPQLVNAQGRIFKGTVGSRNVVLCLNHKPNDEVTGWCYYPAKGNNHIKIDGYYILGQYTIHEWSNTDIVGIFEVSLDNSKKNLSGNYTKIGSESKVQVKLQFSGNEGASENQQSSSHFSFMGIPINGTEAAFGNQLSRKGFRKTVMGGHNVWEGKFNGENVRIGLFTTPKTNTVYMVYVEYLQTYNEYDADNKCDAIKRGVSRKYGVNFTMNTGMSYDIRNDYFATINKDGRKFGLIEVGQVSTAGETYYHVFINYMDLANFQKFNQEQQASYDEAPSYDY